MAKRNLSVGATAVPAVKDVNGVSIREIRTLGGNDHADIVRRLVPDSTLPEQPPVAAFNSSIG